MLPWLTLPLNESVGDCLEKELQSDSACVSQLTNMFIFFLHTTPLYNVLNQKDKHTKNNVLLICDIKILVNNWKKLNI